MTKADYEDRVERAFVSYANATRRPLAAEAKAKLREHYRVYDGDEDALLDLRNVLQGAEVVHKTQSRSVEGPTGKERTKPQKCFDRRYHIVAFVTERLPKSNRPDWKRLVAEWNSAHPLDQVNRNLLKVEYNRALREWDIVMQYLIATRDDRPFREYMRRTMKGPYTRVTGQAALDWIRANVSPSILTVTEKTIAGKKKGGKK